MTQAEIRESARVEVNESAVGTVLKILEGAGALERFRPRENMAIVRINADADEGSLVERLSPQAHVQRTVLLGVEGLVQNRLGEPIYFQPDDFAARLGLDRVALGRALRHLASELPVDYIPPFRGNALRIADRTKKARDLMIDFSALDVRKRQEYEKLDRMVRYAKAPGCRRGYILSYFGDTEAGSANCGRCDNCDPNADPKPPAAEPVAIDTSAGREVIQKVLSGVARARGRFGKTLVAQMLHGSGSERIVRFGLAKLSTFGILKDFRQAEVIQLLDALTEAGLVETQEIDRFKPVIALGEAGRAWLKAEAPEPLILDLPPDLGAKVRNGGLERRSRQVPAATTPREVGPSVREFSPAAAADDDEAGPIVDGDGLRERLKSTRLELARVAGCKAFHIFTDKTLDALIAERPQTPHALAAIRGIGPSTLERHGNALLAVLRGAIRESVTATLLEDESEPPGPRAELPRAAPRVTAPATSREVKSAPVSRPVAVPSGAYVSTEEWTWRLLEKGFSLDEAAAIRGLERSAVLRHALWMSREGRSIPLSSFLAPEAQGHWDAWLADHPDDPPPEDLGASTELWPLYLSVKSRG